MSDKPAVTNGIFLPLGNGEKGEVRGLHLGDDGPSLRRLAPVQEGRPIMGDLTTLTRREGSMFLNAETTHISGSRSASRSGPSMVNSQAYRDGWERIFKKKPEEEDVC